MLWGEKEKNVKIKILLLAPSAKNETFYYILMSNLLEVAQILFLYKRSGLLFVLLEKNRYFRMVKNDYLYFSLYTALFPKSWRQPGESDESKIRRAVSSL